MSTEFIPASGAPSGGTFVLAFLAVGAFVAVAWALGRVRDHYSARRDQR